MTTIQKKRRGERRGASARSESGSMRMIVMDMNQVVKAAVAQNLPAMIILTVVTEIRTMSVALPVRIVIGVAISIAVATGPVRTRKKRAR
jgi:hypothetical protein